MDNRIKELRKQKNFSQKKLSEMIGYSQSVISDWENYNAEPTASAVSALANCFGCSIDYLLGRENEEGNIIFAESRRQSGDLKNEDRIKFNKTQEQLTSIEQEFLDYLRTLSRDSQYQVVGFMQALQAQETQLSKISPSKK